MTADTTTLPPADAEVALRSFPRRFRSVFALGDDVDADELARRHGPDGTAAADHLVVADALAALLARALGDVRAGSDASVHPAVVDPAARTWRDDHTPLDALLDQFESNALAAAAAVDALDNDDWGVRVAVAGQGDQIDAVTVLRKVVAAIADSIDAARVTLREVMR